MLAVYAYFDAQRIIRKAEIDEFNFVGTWASTGTFISSFRDTVNYANGQYVCIVDNVDYNPQLPDTIEAPQKWSPLILVSPGTPSDSSLAQAAYDLAIIGTNTGTAALELAQAAFSIAVIGTNTSQSSLAVAEQAFTLAVIGTNVGTAALTLATAGSNLAWAAFVLAESGTSGADPQTLAIAQAAFSIAVIGTNVGTNAYNLATSAFGTASEALNIAIIGTNAGAQAQALANEALQIAIIGTNTGTNAFNLATSAAAIASEALAIAIIGTNTTTTALNLISAGTTFGTNIAIANGTNFIWVNGLGLPFTPACVVCTMQMPDINSQNLWPTLVGQPTSNGFVISLNGSTDSALYRLHYMFRR
jgi:hypothetical protein